MDYYECYLNSDKGGQQLIMRQAFDQIASLKRQVDALTKEVQVNARPPNPLDKLNHQAHADMAARVWAESMKGTANIAHK